MSIILCMLFCIVLFAYFLSVLITAILHFSAAGNNSGMSFYTVGVKFFLAFFTFHTVSI